MSLDLVTRMSFGLAVDKPELNYLTESFHESTGDVVEPAGGVSFWGGEIEIANPHVPISDITLTVRYFGSKPSNKIVRIVDGKDHTLAEAFSNFGIFCDTAEFTEDTVVLPVATWLAHLAELSPGEPMRIGSLAPITLFQPCTSIMSLDVDYEQRKVGPADGDNYTWRVFPVTNHKTLVANRSESRGTPHFHQGNFAINRRTGKLVIVSESHSGLQNQATISGGGMGPANDDGTAIPTRSQPGTFESVSTGRLRGVVAEFKSDGECPDV